jgi:hypothetical protein
LLTVFITLTGAGARARAAETLPAGTIEVGLALGVSVSHPVPDVEPPLGTVSGLHLLPRLGYVAVSGVGPGWLEGSLELLLEPTLLRVDDDSDLMLGASALARWVFVTGRAVRPFVEAGLGAVGGRSRLGQTTCDVNFIIEAGPGLMIFLTDRAAVTVGYRLHHVSNADLCGLNRGLNSSLVTVGLSYFFP